MQEPFPSTEVEGWWARWPQSNLGVVTGSVSGVAVLDIDPRNDGNESLVGIERLWGAFDLTAEVATGGGGRHLWFAMDTAVPSIDVAPGIELKSEGGVVVAPPSMHASGVRYRWLVEPWEVRLAPLPAWLADLANADLPGSPTPRARPTRTASERSDFAAAWHRAGIELVAGDRYYLCPFHPDHHPSLHIDADGCRWYCFGCHRGGGIGRLLRELGENAGPVRPMARQEAHVGVAFPITMSGDHRIDVVGESRHQDELLAITGGYRHYAGVDVEAIATLLPDPDNEFDSEAVEVRIDGRAVGHVRRRDLAWLRPMIDRSRAHHGYATCRATVRGGWDRGRGEVGFFGVVLFVPEEV